jgi:hypothetical protein
VAGRWFSSINKTDRHDIAEQLLKVALNNTTLTQKLQTLKQPKRYCFAAKVRWIETNYLIDLFKKGHPSYKAYFSLQNG